MLIIPDLTLRADVASNKRANRQLKLLFPRVFCDGKQTIDLVRQRSPSDGSGSELRYWVGFFGVVSLPLKTAFGTIGNCRLRLY